ncbi:MAG TPA: DUF92 domain-containing protein [Anaerolineaceae bacterium]|nr:DUF92 domain-containing protein [Anaerolineaceae bacterium]HPN52305.1 DUF92 domain-containing protein [Anaerolineaceae bacterium]
MQLGLGLLAGAAIAFLAYRAHALSLSGALAAAALGTVIFGLGGLPWAVLLLAFFITSSALSRLFARRKNPLNEKFSKGSRRDAGQVLANGGMAGLLVLIDVLLAWLRPDLNLRLALWLAFAASLAAANADTWATELGVLSRSAPVLISTGRKVEPGTSGGVSLWGTLAAFSGAALIALLALLMNGWTAVISPLQALIIALGGLLGSLFDSLLGATVQAIYTCPTCRKETERHPLHTCGTPTLPLRGLPWLDNDWVNIGCTLVGAAFALLLAFLGV